MVVERELPGLGVPQVIVPDGAEALGVMVGHALGDPARAMTMIGITGTNGKTTTTYLVEAALMAAGYRPGVIGTVTYRWGARTGDRSTRRTRRRRRRSSTRCSRGCATPGARTS